MIRRSLVVDARWPEPARKLRGLVQQLLAISGQQAEGVIHRGGVRVNGRVVTKPQTTLEVGDRVEGVYDAGEMQPPPRRGDGFQSLEIIYDDPHLVVVNKPPAVLTVPTPYRERNTLIALLEKRLRRDGRGEQAFCVHRLDRGVSGLLVFGKRLEVAEALRNQFEARKPLRRYVAIVAGRPAPDTGTFRTFLATDKSLNRYSTSDPEAGELAITHYRSVRWWPAATLLEVWLETGRRHQIRVHLAEAGHPVLGDPRYGQHAVPVQLWPHRRLALHAARLGFQHPLDGRNLDFRSPWPAEMAAFARSQAEAESSAPRHASPTAAHPGRHRRRS